MRRGPATATREAVPLSELVDGWVAAGLISAEQGTALRKGAAPTASVPRAPAGAARSVVVEALGYLGGAIVVAATLLLGSLYWDELGSGARLLLLAGTTVGLAVAGLLVPAEHEAATGRLRSVLWLAAVVAGAFAWAITADVLDLGETGTALLLTWASAALAALLWYRWRTVLQQVVTMVATAAGGVALVSSFDVPDETLGLGVWTVGVVWALLAWGELTRPRWVGLGGGAALAIVGAMMTSGTDLGTVFTLATLVLVVAAALWLRDVAMLGVGALGVVLNVPAAADRWFPGSVGVSLALLVVGIGIVAVAVLVARRDRPDHPHREARVGDPSLALVTACIVVASVAAVVAAILRAS